MKTINLITALIFSISTASAYDFRTHDRNPSTSCIKEKWTLLNTEEESHCEKVQELELKSMEKTYPLMNVGPLKVRYWQGKFVKVITSLNTYEHSYVNVCTGAKTYSEIENIESVRYEHYRIFNPNLSNEIEQSFETAPMTKAEAQTSMIELEKSCNR